MEPPISGSNFRSTVFESIEDPVSAEIMTKVVSLVPCGHTLNEDTAIQIIAFNNICPLDRQRIQSYTPNYAVRQLAEAASSMPSKEEPSKEAEELFLKGKELADQEKYEEAVSVLLEVLCLNQSYEKAQAYLDFCLKQTSSKLQPPPACSDASVKETKLSSDSPKEKFTDLLLKLLDDPQIQRNKTLYSIFDRQLDMLTDQEAEELTQQQKILYKWSQRLLIQDKMHQHVARKIQDICKGFQRRPSSIPSPALSTPSITLHQAARRGDVGAIKLLIDSGAKVDAKNRRGSTPFHYAAYYGHVDAIKLLINSGAKVDAENCRRSTPLHCAAYNGHVDAIRLLIDSGAKVDAISYRSSPDSTPLHWVSRNGCILGWSSTPLSWAAQNGHIDAIKLLLDKGARVDVNGVWTPLRCAAYYGQVNAIKLLIDKGAQIDAKNGSDLTPLHGAAQNGHIDAIKLLIDKGAQIDAKDHWGSTPLHEAAEGGHVDAIKLLIDKGAQIDAKNGSDLTPLHGAAQNGHIDAIKLLIDKGAQIDAKDHWGSTPLHEAAEGGHVDAIKLLIDKGAQVDAKNSKGLTPLQNAELFGHKEAVKELRHHQKSVWDTLRKYFS